MGRSPARRCSSPMGSTHTRRSSADPPGMTLTNCAASLRNSWPCVNADSSCCPGLRAPRPYGPHAPTGSRLPPPSPQTRPTPTTRTHTGPICRRHHRKPDPHTPPEPTRVPFAATDTATGTHSGSEHSHGDRPTAAATPTRPSLLPLAAATTAPPPHSHPPPPPGSHLPPPSPQTRPAHTTRTHTGPVCRNRYGNRHPQRIRAQPRRPPHRSGHGHEAPCPGLRDPHDGAIPQARAAKRARLPLPVAWDERAGVEVAVRVG